MERIGWIGTGVMGKSMCMHILKKGYAVSVYNLTKAKADDLCRLGAVWCDSPGAAAAQSDMIFSMVGEPPDVEQVILGKGGVLETDETQAFYKVLDRLNRP